ncbi:MAG TPA: vanadium-dependent haloperoxidase [Allosphingosinicella sp.]|nr:vanadium-dependent haloperoxidase [Allosphingosinicella sp.]
MNKLGKAAAAAALAFTSAPASADTICEWYDFSLAIAAAGAPAPGMPRTPDHDRATTQATLAMFEAVNAIDRRYQSYLNLPVRDSRASQDAAAVTAAYRVLLEHYPAQRTALDDSYTLAMNGIPDEAAREAGRAIGEEAARAALGVGGIDPQVTQTPYRPRAQPGVWTATQLPVYEPFATAFRPWILPRVDAVRPSPPPALTSERWARDLDEVRRLGGRSSSERTAQQSLMARYRITPNMMPSIRNTLDAPNRRLVDNARLVALVSMVADDIGMATAEAKLHYNFWRPITAIRNADSDGNDATPPDPNWEPLINTPNHPEYPCAHCSYAGGFAELMAAVTGPRPAAGVRVASRSIPNSAVQVMPSWDDWVREVSFSRTLGGVHYRFSNEAGEQIGREVARMALRNVMQPLPGTSD